MRLDDPWTMKVDAQYNEFFIDDHNLHKSDLRSWYEWLESEWNCELILTDNGRGIDGFSFTDEEFLMAVLKYGPPTLSYEQALSSGALTYEEQSPLEIDAGQA